jgi:hypothetical protein
MSAALVAEPTSISRPVVVRTAPRREPPFDDELVEAGHRPKAFDRRLPFDLAGVSAAERRRLLSANGLPDPVVWARRLLVGLIECAGGRRPLAQLTNMLSPSVIRGLRSDFERANERGRGHWLHRTTVLSLRGCQPADGIAELCAAIDSGPRVRALAMRIEMHHGRWCCTRLQLG